MSSHWRVIDASRYQGKVEARRGAVLVHGQRIPLDDVTAVLVGPDTEWSGGVMALLGQYGVPLLTCDWRGVPVSYSIPWSENSRVAARHRAQSRLAIPRQKNAWMQIVRSKVRGQANNVECLTPDVAAKLNQLASSVRSGDPSNVEAQAARLYWSALFLPGTSFNREPGAGFGLNAMLDYGYAILRGITVRAVCEAGLWPTLGIWHKNRANAFCLADDLIEPFRPAVDSTVAAMAIHDDDLNPDSKRELVAVSAKTFHRAGHSVSTEIGALARRFAQYIEGDETRLDVGAWAPPRG